MENSKKIEIYNKIWENNRKVREYENEIKKLLLENSQYHKEIDDYYCHTYITNEK